MGLKKTEDYKLSVYAKAGQRLAGLAKAKTKAKSIAKPGRVNLEWTDELKDLVRSKYPDTNTAELAAALGINTAALVKKAQILGVKKSAEFIRKQNTHAKNLVMNVTPIGSSHPESKRHISKRGKGMIMIDGSFVKPDPSMTFEKATKNRVRLSVKINGKTATVYCVPGMEDETRKKYEAHNVQPPRSFNRNGGHAI